MPVNSSLVVYAMFLKSKMFVDLYGMAPRIYNVEIVMNVETFLTINRFRVKGGYREGLLNFGTYHEQ